MNPNAGRWILQCLGHDVGGIRQQHTLGLDRLLNTSGFLVSGKSDLFENAKRHRARFDATISRLIYISLLSHEGLLIADSGNFVDAVAIHTGDGTSDAQTHEREDFANVEDTQHYDPNVDETGDVKIIPKKHSSAVRTPM